MTTPNLISKVRDAMDVRTAIGEPVVHDGIVVVPAAKVRGGAGGGTGSDGADGTGSGEGFGVTSTPIGAFVIKDGQVTWRPAIDINKVIIGGQIVAVVALLTIRAIVKARSRR